jgi:Na+/H+ antiporter NhaD/arsenite permease-like protein
MWVIGLITFFMSAILDNLTTTIVMVSLVKKILPDQEDRYMYVHIYLYVSIYMYTYIYKCMYIHINLYLYLYGNFG